MKTSIIILTYNNLELTKHCIASIYQFTRTDSYELIVVDNNSMDGTTEWLKIQPFKVIYNSENKGFPAGCNQGIQAAEGDNILLLNNDTLVTINWLDNLVTCLYSSEDVGAVGPVTNYATYNTAISVSHKNPSEVHQFARQFNISNPDLWEQRIKLVGFCLLIKRKVIDEIGLLDETFTPGHYEDDDYSVRLRRAGYKLFLCKDVFIHHFGNASFRDMPEVFRQSIQNNIVKFENKWGFNPEYSSYIRTDIINGLSDSKEKPINVLDVGCGCGATLLKIKTIYKNAGLFGIELNENSAIDARLYADVRPINVEETKLDYPRNYFDYMIFADVLEHISDPWKVLENIKEYLAPAGYILSSIPNVMHYSVIKNLLDGYWTYENAGILDKTHLRFFTLHEIKKMFSDTGYVIESIGTSPTPVTEEGQQLIRKLNEVANKDLTAQYSAYQYIIKARKEELMQ